MNGSILVCPQCKQGVRLPPEAKYTRCPSCNRFLFRAPRAEAAPDGAGSLTLRDFAKTLGMVIVMIFFILGLGAVVIGIVFVGCVASMGRH